MRLAYVHDAPDHPSIDTRWRDPRHLAERGFTDVVVADQMSGALGLVLPQSDNRLVADEMAAITDRIEQAGAMDLGTWIMDDLWTLSIDDSTCPANQEPWDRSAAAFHQLASSFPEVTGFIVRIGERFSSPRTWVRRADPLSCSCPSCADIDIDERRRLIVRFVERVVCSELGLRCILRLWDLGPDGVHADPKRAAAMLEAWEGDERLIFSIKHTQTDYWRYQPWNPTLSTIEAPCLIELQCEREYECIGMVANWLGDLWANGPSECGEQGVAGIANIRPKDWLGTYILPRGGGWSAPHASDDLWADLNVSAAIALTLNPMRDPDSILIEWLREKALPERLAEPLRISGERMLQLRYPSTWRLISDSVWMPAENWMRDDCFVPGALARMATSIVDSGLVSRFLSERSEVTSATAADLSLVSSILEGNVHGRRRHIEGSFALMNDIAAWTESLWVNLLGRAPLDRSQAADTVAMLLAERPLLPFKVLA